MRLIALLAHSNSQAERFAQFRDTADRFQFIPMATEPVGTLLPSLTRTGFAGALVLHEGAQVGLSQAASRLTVAAQDAGRADVYTVQEAFTMGDYTVAQGLHRLLELRRYRLTGANIVIIGGNHTAKMFAASLAKHQPRTVTVVATDLVRAEGALPRASGVLVAARAAIDPHVEKHLREADMIIRTEAISAIPVGILGPHLVLIDLAGENGGDTQRYAEAAGAAYYGVRELELFRVQIALEQLLRLTLAPAELQGLLRHA